MPDLNALTSLLGAIRSTYPQARITSTYRGPNNPLTLKNPRSPHRFGSPDNPTAVDIAPIPGVDFNDYVNSIRKQGVNIGHYYDEAKHPFKWTTGPNWHLDTAGAPQQVAAAPVKKPRTLANIANPVPQTPSLAAMAQAPSPISMDAPAPAMHGPDLASVAGAMPGVPEHKKSPFTLANILGVLGDGLLGYAGRPAEFAPALAQQQQDDRTQGLEREKFNAALEARRQAALLPKAPTQTQQFVDEIMNPNTPPERKALLRAILTKPLITTMTNADGSQYQNSAYPGQGNGSDDDWEYNN